MATALLEEFQSIELLVQMSIGTDRGLWWADPEFGSDLWKIRRYGKVGPQTVGEVKRAIEDALKWIKSDGLADSIDVEAVQAGRTMIAYSVSITRPDGSTASVKDVWNGL